MKDTFELHCGRCETVFYLSSASAASILNSVSSVMRLTEKCWTYSEDVFTQGPVGWLEPILGVKASSAVIMLSLIGVHMNIMQHGDNFTQYIHLFSYEKT